MKIFNFNCSLCGAEPESQDFESFVDNWPIVESKKTFTLLESVYGLLCEILAKDRIDLPISLLYAVEILRNSFAPFIEDGSIRPIYVTKDIDISSFRFLGLCPLCGSGPGIRRKGKYFTNWEFAELVQIANLLYENDIILWNTLKKLPQWATGSILNNINCIRRGLQLSGQSTGLLKCPKCGRFTTCLYGEKDQFCRWCLDDKGGGAFLKISLNYDYVNEPDDIIKVDSPSNFDLSKKELKLLPPFSPLVCNTDTGKALNPAKMDFYQIIEILRQTRDLPNSILEKEYEKRGLNACMSLFLFFREITDLVNANVANLFFNSIDYQYFNLIHIQNVPHLLYIKYKPYSFKDLKFSNGYEFGLYARVYRGSKKYGVDTYIDVDLPLSEAEYREAAKMLLNDYRAIIYNILIMGGVRLESSIDGEILCTDKNKAKKIEKYLSSDNSATLFAKMSSDNIQNFFGFCALTIIWGPLKIGSFCQNGAEIEQQSTL